MELPEHLQLFSILLPIDAEPIALGNASHKASFELAMMIVSVMCHVSDEAKSSL
jgi:hypothetical protein